MGDSINPNAGRCPQCGRKCYLRSDKSPVCHQCGYGTRIIKRNKYTFYCTKCNRQIYYIKSNKLGRCRNCGDVVPVNQEGLNETSSK